MKLQSGFTFLEAMVAGVIGLVIPSVLIILLHISNREAGRDAVRARLSQIATVVSEDIHRAGYGATWVYGLSQSGMTDTKCTDTADPNEGGDSKGFAFCDDLRNVIKAYRIQPGPGSAGELEEYDPINGWRPMSIGGVTVGISRNDVPFYIGQPTIRESGVFGIGDKGAWAWTNLHFHTLISGDSLTLPMQMQSVVCRNSPSRISTL